MTDLSRNSTIASVRTQDPSATISAPLLENSFASALSAIEIYNKPDTKYREQVFSILIVYAWELLLKAKLVADSGERLEPIYILREDGQPKLNRTGQPLTVELLSAVKKLNLGPAVVGNL